jgi:hypothetical protein
MGAENDRNIPMLYIFMVVENDLDGELVLNIMNFLTDQVDLLQ